MAVIVGVGLPAAGAHAGQHADGPAIRGHIGHDHSSAAGAVHSWPEGDHVAWLVAELTCDAAAGHCVTSLMLPSQVSLRVPAASASVCRLHPDYAWQHQMPDTATPPPRA